LTCIVADSYHDLFKAISTRPLGNDMIDPTVSCEQWAD